MKKILIGVIVLFILIIAFFIYRQIQSDIKTTTPVYELKIEDLKVGRGVEVKSGDKVIMHYKGTLLNGKKFDSSYDKGRPFETQIGTGQVIRGWDEGIPGMKAGGKRRLTIPAHLAYGERGFPPVIPPNSTLIFEVELISIK